MYAEQVLSSNPVTTTAALDTNGEPGLFSKADLPRPMVVKPPTVQTGDIAAAGPHTDADKQTSAQIPIPGNKSNLSLVFS